MLIIKNDKVIFCDVDETLIHFNKSKYEPFLQSIDLEANGFTTTVQVNQKNVNLLTKLSKMGYTIIVWSATGFSWAEEVCKKLKIEQYVTACMSKPRYHIDDKESSVWMGDRIWRDPLSGEE